MKEHRVAMYRFLSIGFTYPKEGFCEIMNRALEMVRESYSLLNSNGYKIVGIQNLKKGLKSLQNMEPEELEALYTSLFISNYPKVPLHPYESFYKGGLLVSEATDSIRELYEECGVEVFDDREFPDIISLELEFASFLVEHEISCKPVFDGFFNEHLFSWIFDFFKDLSSYSKTPLFYKALSSMGSTFLKREQKQIKRLLYAPES